MTKTLLSVVQFLSFFVLSSMLVVAEDQPNSNDSASADLQTLAGHSKHGEVFNEGPRQRAYLMPGTGEIKFEVTSDNSLVQKFVEQGIGQLHGFWFFEAERSFRQAAMLDPDCAIAYWGMSRANENNEERAIEFIERAFELIDNASPREEMYILAQHEFLTNKDGKKKEREAAYVEAIEEIIEEFPDDLEAKALLGYALYKYRSAADRSHAEVDVVLDEVLAKAKYHPVHHYRIHLWDHKSPQRALDSAAKCGPSADTIAHMWHMCGHIFSRVKRYGDAAWFQEASARVDHRHMMHDRVLPDQIHNFAHNNEWLIRNLMNVGRVKEALDLAKNMIELPRHPKYNSLDKRNSAKYGRERLVNVLERFELWDEAIALSVGPYLEPTDLEDEQLRRLRLLGRAFAMTNQLASAHAIAEEMETMLDAKRGEEPTEDSVRKALEEQDAKDAEDDWLNGDDEDEAEDDELTEEEAEKKAKKEFEKRLKKELKDRKAEHEREVERLEHAIASTNGYLALARGEHQEAVTLLEKADEDKLELAKVRLLLDDVEQDQKAFDEAASYAKDRKKQVRPLAGLVEVAWKAGKHHEAMEAFVRLRACSNWLELDSAVFQRLTPIVKEMGFPEDWRVQTPAPEDLGKQPPLEELGPFRWIPTPAPDWLLPDSSGQLHSLREYRGRPFIMVFYLGYGCLHCAEQLQAIAPLVEEFEKAGISLIAVSSDNVEGLEKSQENYDGERIPFPLVANPSHDIFKAFRAYDDFEDLPLHGTYLIDGEGRIRWQDISYDPFMDVDFLLKESKRLLAQGKKQETPTDELAKQQ